MAKRRKRSRAAHRRRRPVSVNAPKRRRRRRRHTMAVNPSHRRHTRRRYRRNPGITGSVKGMGGMLVQGLKDGFVVRLGAGLTKYVGTKIPIGTAGSPTQGAVQLVVGTALSLGVKKFMGQRAAEFFLAGAAADVIGTLIPTTIPVVGPILGAGALSSYARLPMGSYARVAPGGVSAYVAAPAALAGWDDNDPNLSDGIFS